MSWLAEWLLAYQEGLRSMELVGLLVNRFLHGKNKVKLTLNLIKYHAMK
jgi:hypothetical protein